MTDLRFFPLGVRACLAASVAMLLPLETGCEPPRGAAPNVTSTADEAEPAEATPAEPDKAAPDDAEAEAAAAGGATAATTTASADVTADSSAAETDIVAAGGTTADDSTADDSTAESATAGASGRRTAAADAAGAKLSGRVVLDGAAPPRRPINMSKDKKCIELHEGEPVLDEAVLIGENGGVKNAFVYIRRGAPKKEYPVPDEPARLDQKNCMYRPRVQGMLVGQRLLVGNDDPVTHNVRSFPVRSRPFNFGQPAGSEPRERVFEAAEREIEVQCDIHPWMHAFVFVMDHPFFCVTGDDGSYTIESLPPGEYTVEVWHEKFGRARQDVTIGEGDAQGVDFTYKP